MIIYKDLITGDELFTDAYKVKGEGIFYVVEGKYVTVAQDKIDEKLIGGNASAEGEDVADLDDDQKVSGINICLSNRLVETGFKDKKDYQKYIKVYMKKIVEKLTERNPERVAEFKAAAAPAIKKVCDNFSDYQFFMGESCDPEGMHVLVLYEGETPYLYFFKDGLEEEKV